jgi:hypothetical protein
MCNYVTSVAEGTQEGAELNNSRHSRLHSHGQWPLGPGARGCCDSEAELS